MSLGKVTSIEHNHKQKQIVKKGEPSVAIKVEVAPHETPRISGRHYQETDTLYSQVCKRHSWFIRLDISTVNRHTEDNL